MSLTNPQTRRRSTRLGALVAGCLLALGACAVGGGRGGASPHAAAAGYVQAWPQITSAVAPDPAIEARVAAMVAGMSLEQKVGQMTQAEIRHATPADATRYYLGSVLNGGGSRPGGNKHATAAQWLALAEAYHDASLATAGTVKVPIIWGTDAVHGHNNVFGATIFPHHIGIGASRDAALAAELGEATARAVRASGLAWVFAPTLAVAKDPRWGRTYESFSEDPAVVGALGGAYAQGLQRGLGGPGAAKGVVATAKHYIGDGGTELGTDQGINRASQAQLIQQHGAGYVTALTAGVQTVMASFHSWHDSASGVDHGKVHGSHYLLTRVLKERMGFDGFVVSDWNGIGQIPGCTDDSCAQAINAGMDMVMVPEDWKAFITNTVAQVRSGQIPMARIDDAVTRILRVKLRAGLFSQRPSQAPGAGDTAALQARSLAQRAVRQSLVLLKNNAQVLPLKRGQRVLVVGKAADSLELQTGGWSLSWQGTGNTNAEFPAGDTLLAGVRAAVGAKQVSFSADAQGVNVRDFDAVIAVIGETPYAEGNGDIPPSGTMHHASRYPEDLAVLQRVAGQGVPVVTVLYSGRVVHANDLINRSDAFVAAWLPGTEGATIADLLFRAADGRVAHKFVGRLPFSWPRAACQVPLHAGVPGYDPLFAFGYGLGVASRSTVAVLSEALPGGGCAAAQEMVIFNQSARAPYTLTVGSVDRSWREQRVGVDPNATLEWPEAAPAVRVSTVQMHTQQDALRVQWRAPAVLQAWAAQKAVLGAYEHGALVFDVRVAQPPRGAVALGMVCGRPCGAALDIAPLLAKVRPSVATTIKIPLACFAAAGVDLGRVEVPFSVRAGAPLDAAFARIRVAAGAARDADALRCETLPTLPLNP